MKPITSGLRSGPSRAGSAAPANRVPGNSAAHENCGTNPPPSAGVSESTASALKTLIEVVRGRTGRVLMLRNKARTSDRTQARTLAGLESEALCDLDYAGPLGLRATTRGSGSRETQPRSRLEAKTS